MSGYVGFTNFINNSNLVIGEMMEKIKHRGPDSEWKFIDEGVALGFCKLNVTNLKQDCQPIQNKEKNKTIAFNGKIYNYKDVRQKLMDAGHSFKTDSDSELILHGYEEYGVDILNMLRGMFSFVIWDANKKELFGVRDPFGIKPLYYAMMDKTFIFGSEIKSFLPHPHFNKELNETALENYLTFQYSPTNETFFKNVYKLPAAHYFIYKEGNFTAKRYWEVKFKADDKPTLEEWVEEISSVFNNSVKAHKIGDAEVASFLSSGVDSSYVAAVANVDKTFTVGFGEDEKYNEIGWAKEFSKYINKENHSKVVTPEEYWGILPKIQYHMDEPLADPAAVALYFVCNIASEKVKVVLSGEGADEIFGGYNVYKEPSGSPVYSKIPRPIRRGIGSIASKLPAKRGVNFLVRKGMDLEERFIGNAYMFTVEERKKLLKIKTNAPNPMEITKPFYDLVKENDDVTKMQYLDLHLWMTGDILLKADRMSMANSIELRVPFLDKEVLSVALKIPTKFRVHKENTKYAMRLAAKKSTPPQTANKKKLGFPVPIRVWLKEDKYYNIVKEYFVSETAEKYFNTDILMKLLDEHKTGAKDNSRKIWTVLMFLVWHKVYFEQ